MKNSLLVSFIACCVIVTAQSQYNNDIIVETVLKSDTTSIGQKISYPNVHDTEVTIAKVTIPPGKSTGWHKHHIPVFAYVQQGTLSVEIENRELVHFPENTSFAEVIHTYHNGTNLGEEDVVLIAFYMGESGKKLSIKKEE